MDCFRLICHGPGILCARCTGIYGGFLAGMIYLWCTGGRKRSFPPSSISLTAAGLFLLTPLQVFLQAYFPALGNDWVKFGLGLAGGSSLALFIYPLWACFAVDGVDGRAVAGWPGYGRFLIPQVLPVGFYAAGLAGSAGLATAVRLPAVMGAVTIYLTVDYSLAAAVTGRGRRGRYLTVVLRALLTLLFLVVEIWLLYMHALSRC